MGDGRGQMGDGRGQTGDGQGWTGTDGDGHAESAPEPPFRVLFMNDYEPERICVWPAKASFLQPLG